MPRKFIKMHGLGNDFAVFDGRNDGWQPDAAQIRTISDRRFGIGCDQMIVLGKSATADVYMHIYNADGSVVGACGNASRCVGVLLINEFKKEKITIETKAGFLTAVKNGEGVTLDMGQPGLAWQQIPVSGETETLSVVVDDHLPAAALVSMGNPHAVFFVDEDVNVAELGSRIETHPLFPEKTNVEFVKVIDRRTLRMKVWERGAGITLACGTGACASVVAAVRRGLTDRQVKVILDGGALDIDWREGDNHVLMTGPGVEVYRGEIEI